MKATFGVKAGDQAEVTLELETCLVATKKLALDKWNNCSIIGFAHSKKSQNPYINFDGMRRNWQLNCSKT